MSLVMSPTWEHACTLEDFNDFEKLFDVLEKPPTEVEACPLRGFLASLLVVALVAFPGEMLCDVLEILRERLSNTDEERELR